MSYKQHLFNSLSRLRKYAVVSISLLIASSALFAVLSGVAVASVQDFEVNNFSADYFLTRGDKQGQLLVNEKIDVTFSDQNHGILRAIPESYRGHSLQLRITNVSSSTGAPSSYTVYKSGGHRVLKIGDPSKTVTGKQSYNIAYSVSNVIGFYKDHDELYWDINGDQWEQSFDHVESHITLPADIQLGSHVPQCFTGVYGSTSSDCTMNVITGQVQPIIRTVNAQTNKLMGPRSTLTVVVGFNKGYFTEPTLTDKLLSYAKPAIEVLLPILIFGGIAISQWRKKGRDASNIHTIIPEYQPPNNLRPAQVGMLTDFKLDNKDITASIIDLAIRGYIKIIESVEKHTLRKDSLNYSLQISKTDFTGLTSYETEIMTGIFGATLTDGASVHIKDLNNKFYTTVAQVKKLLNSGLVSDGYFVSNPATAGGWLIAMAAGLFFLGIFVRFAGVFVSVGLVISAIITAICAANMPALTAKGVDAKQKALGLKLYIETAEADRIKMMQSPNAPLAENGQMPEHTVKLFEKLLPYAILFGIEKQWAEEYKDIYSVPPQWYGGSMNSFNTFYLVNSLGNNFATSMNTTFTAPSSSGSSGFGGGGFSGGGGGGGGGGGW